MSNFGTKNSFRFLEGGGEMGALIRSVDWDNNPLGTPANWPQSLRTIISIILNSKFPMFLWWGPELIQFYNDAYRPSLGNQGKHPAAMGQRAEVCWPEIWHIISPLIKQVMTTGESTWSEDQLIPIYRNGKMEDVYWTFSYSLVHDEADKIAGVLVTCTETTDKIVSIKKITENKTDLEFTIVAAELGIFDLNPSTNKFTGNARLKQWFGIAGDADIELSLAIDAIAKKDQIRVIEAIQTALQQSSGGNYDIEYTIVHPHTRMERIVRARGKALFNEQGEASRFNGIVQDITQETLSRRALAESEKTFRAMILQAPVAICILRGPIHIVEIANDRMVELWGKTTEEVLNKPIFKGLPEVKEQGLEDILYNVYTTGNAFVANEHPILLPRNAKIETTYINFIYEAIREGNGKISGVAVVATDVTEQVMSRKIAEENERQFRQIADSMPQIVWTAQPDGYIDYYNRQWYNYTGFKKSFGDQSWTPLLYPDDVDRCLKTWYNCVKTGRNYDIEYRFVDRKNPGTYRWFLGRAAPIKNEDGTIIKWFGTCTDINDQKLLQQQKDDFVSVASHELKTPLTSAKASIQLIELLVKNQHIDQEKLQKIASTANNNLKKLSKLVEDLFNATRIEQGQMLLAKTWFNLYDAILECCEHVKLVGTHHITIDGDKNLNVFADMQKVEQVIVNLVNNAVKYGGESREIKISFSDFPESVKVSVHDSGIGIAPAKLPYLFDRYYRVDTSGIQYAGLGLGLYISSEIIKKHGGKIGVDSTEGKGSCFWFTLPVEGMIR
jgi:PAS domain S-box-containing protein